MWQLVRCGQEPTGQAQALALVMVSSIAGNFWRPQLHGGTGYRPTIVVMCLAYFVAMYLRRTACRAITTSMWCWLFARRHLPGCVCALHDVLAAAVSDAAADDGGRVFYNIGRLAAAFGTVYFGTFSQGGRLSAGAVITLRFLFIPAAVFALLLPELPLVSGRWSR